MYGWRPVVAAKTAAAVRGSVDCCTGLGVPGQPWTAAAAAAAARAPLTACGDCVPPEPAKHSMSISKLTENVRVLPVVEVTTPEVSPLIPAAVGRPAIGDRYEPSEASEAGLVVAAARAACCCCCCCCINCCKEGKEGLTNGS